MVSKDIQDAFGVMNRVKMNRHLRQFKRAFPDIPTRDYLPFIAHISGFDKAAQKRMMDAFAFNPAKYRTPQDACELIQSEVRAFFDNPTIMSIGAEPEFDKRLRRLKIIGDKVKLDGIVSKMARTDISGYSEWEREVARRVGDDYFADFCLEGLAALSFYAACCEVQMRPMGAEGTDFRIQSQGIVADVEVRHWRLERELRGGLEGGKTHPMRIKVPNKPKHVANMVKSAERQLQDSDIGIVFLYSGNDSMDEVDFRQARVGLPDNLAGVIFSGMWDAGCEWTANPQLSKDVKTKVAKIVDKLSESMRVYGLGDAPLYSEQS